MPSVCGVPTPTGERHDATGRGAVVVRATVAVTVAALAGTAALRRTDWVRSMCLASAMALGLAQS
jgi:hypothetical protein